MERSLCLCSMFAISSHISLAGPTEGRTPLQRRSNGRKSFPNALKQFSFIFGFLSKLCFSLDPIKINHGIKKETFPDILPFLRFRCCLSHRSSGFRYFSIRVNAFEKVPWKCFMFVQRRSAIMASC